MAKLARLPLLAWVERRIAALPPWAAVARLRVPALALVPVKLLALFLIGKRPCAAGRWRAARGQGAGYGDGGAPVHVDPACVDAAGVVCPLVPALENLEGWCDRPGPVIGPWQAAALESARPVAVGGVPAALWAGARK